MIIGKWLLKVTAPADGKLTGLMLPEGTKVDSFNTIAWVDPGEKNWDKTLLPVAEWPDA